MRPAIIAHLRADPNVTGVVGNRVYGRQGFLGGVSKDRTPEAYDDDGRLMPSLVVVLESRVSREQRDSLGVISATQTIQVWALCGYGGYTEIKRVLRHVRHALHRTATRGVHLVPIEDEWIGWADTRWASTSPELFDDAEKCPTMFDRYDATVTENLT